MFFNLRSFQNKVFIFEMQSVTWISYPEIVLAKQFNLFSLKDHLNIS